MSRITILALCALLIVAGCTALQSKPRIPKQAAVPRGTKAGDYGKPVELVVRTRPLTAPPEITSDTQPGFHDFVFWTKGVALPTKPGWWRFDAEGTYQGKHVTFAILFGPEGKAWEWSGEGEFKFADGYGVLLSKGADSDRFLCGLAKEYGQPAPRKMASQTVVGVIAIGGDPAAPTHGLLRLKLFFGDDESDPNYGEIYVNIDAAKSRLGLIERDPDYEAGLVRTLGGAGTVHGRSASPQSKH